MVDNELSAVATRIIGRPVSVEWVPTLDATGLAVTTAAGYSVKLNPNETTGRIDRMAVLLHELGHLAMGHNMTPAQYNRAGWTPAKVAAWRRRPVTADDAYKQLQREREAWSWAADVADRAGMRDVADHSKRRRAADEMRYIAAQLIEIEQRVSRLERGYG